MAQDLSSWVFGYLVDHHFEDDTVDLVLAAMEGSARLDAALSGDAERPDVDHPSQASPGPAGAFVKSLSVQGFRGVGPKARVDFHPAPGLTIVSGRNGSGKSSLAEALEVALTSKTHRWHNTQFSQVWRNLHQDHPTEIQVELVQEGVGKSTIKVVWPPGEDDNQAAQITYQREGERQEIGLGSLGWTEPLEMYRPILSYEELGQMLMGRSIDLHKALAKVLGLDEIKSGIDLLTERRNRLRVPIAQADRDRRRLRQNLTSFGDERAVAAEQLLRRSQPNLAALRPLAAGETGVTKVGRTLADIGAVSVPNPKDVGAAVAALHDALRKRADLGAKGRSIEDIRRALLEEALRYHNAAGPGPCPVCEQASLDGDWKARTEQTVAQSTLLATQHREAEANLKAAHTRVLFLISAPPRALHQTDLELMTQVEAATAWQLWIDAPSDDQDLGRHVTTTHADLAQAVTAWQQEAAAAAVARSDAWTPVANRLSAWIVQHEEAQTDAEMVGRLTKALEGLQVAERVARTERFAPIVDHAKEIWAKLRHESNVDLHDIVLTGQNNTRRVQISAAVDGTQSGALAVMSQGELHALALSLFLPRAAMDASPFRFIILDDPVQAMDPAKVDGLVAVLSDLAQTRQVIVLSHDDRLPQAARRLAVAPRILEVSRTQGSRLQITQSLDPTKRFLDEAYALFKDDGLPEDTKRLILPGIFRFALETAARDRHLAQQITAGVSHTAAETAWRDARTTSSRIALALVLPDVNRWRSRSPVRIRAMGVCSSGMHGAMAGDIEERLKDVQTTVRDISVGAP